MLVVKLIISRQALGCDMRMSFVTNFELESAQAEEVRAHSRFAKGLRTLAPKSNWFSEMPHDVDML